MASLISSWSSNLQTLPENYIVPQEKRPGMPAPISSDMPVIDLSDPDRGSIVQKILKASQEFGMFQVINHGMEKLMDDAVDVAKEFFSLPAEEIAKLSEQAQNGFMIYSNAPSHQAKAYAFWNDTVQHPCYPLESHMKNWPEKPERYRKVIGPYSTEVRNLGIRVLEMIAEGLGMTDPKFDKSDLFMMIHHYPICPDPSSALGIDGHHDGNLITLLQQDAYGLQLFKDGNWLGVKPVTNAFVINIGFALEVITNGKLKSVVHRAVTNSENVRNSIANFLNVESHDVIIEPSKSLVSPSNPPIYRGYRFKEYYDVLHGNDMNFDATAEHFMIQSQRPN